MFEAIYGNCKVSLFSIIYVMFAMEMCMILTSTFRTGQSRI